MMVFVPQILNFIREIPSEVQFSFCVFFGSFLVLHFIVSSIEINRLHTRLARKEEKILNSVTSRLRRRVEQRMEEYNFSSRIDKLEETVQTLQNNVSNVAVNYECENSNEKLSELKSSILNLEEIVAFIISQQLSEHSVEEMLKRVPGVVLEFIYGRNLLNFFEDIALILQNKDSIATIRKLTFKNPECVAVRKVVEKIQTDLKQKDEEKEREEKEEDN